ncbi:5-dehydro-2-deoxygluconokinase [Lactococcus ileimucosae]|uniref:5-dehydro-2-deoxygluconokinase n=1 Tax=Lactococcus ileimucosae TaxID=2941329 RepID=UPI0020435B18|nr:5-dehydro-2-deoxygluconokinase [Lactococcus ileimucosae]
MKKKFDIIAVGRAAIDLNAVELHQPMEKTKTFKKYVGGSPANIVIGARKMGLKTGFIGKLSDDQHGRFIMNYLREKDVDTSGVVFDKEGHKSGLAFTEILSPSESSILMYRQGVADLYLSPEEIFEDYIKQTHYLLISGTGLAQSPSREAILKALLLARKNGIPVILELDYREYTWHSSEETAIYYQLVAQQSDILIGTRDEFDVLENKREGENQATVSELFKYRPELIVIKHGVDGSFAYEKNGNITNGKAYKAKVMKTFGAGDSYAAAFITALRKGESIKTALKYGAAAAAIVVSKHSSSEAMPTLEEIKALIAAQD